MAVTKRKTAFTAEWFIISKKTIYKITGAAIALIILVVIGYLVKAKIKQIEDEGIGNSHSARFLRLEGHVTIKHAGSGGSVPATPNMALEPGDTVQTGTDGTALVEYEDGSRYTIKSGSTIILKENSEKEKRVVNILNEGNVKISTQENSIRHIVDTPAGIKTDVGKSSDVGIVTKDGKATVVVGRGLASLFTAQGEQKLTENQRIDVSSEGLKRSDLPPPPELATPENTKELLIDQGAELDFAWKPVPDADYYNIMISSTISFPEQSLSVNAPGITETKYTWHKPLEGGFFWRVQAITKDGLEGRWSEISNLRVKIKRDIVHVPIPIRVTRDNKINDLLYEIEGITKPGVMLKINDRQVDVDGAGKFKMDVSFSASLSLRSIIIDALDANGNTGHLEIKH